MSIIKPLKYFDWVLFILISLLLIFGIVIQYSLSLNLEKEGIIFKRHLLFIFIGLIAFFLVSLVNFRSFKFLTLILYFLTIIFLIIVLLFGERFHGVKGWIPLGPFYFQPAELAKIVSLILLAKYWSEKAKKHVGLKEILLSVLLVFPIILLILLQPDFGSALFLSAILLVMIFLNLKKLKQVFYILVILIICFFLAWQFLLQDYQKDRLMTFLNPGDDPFGRGYQIQQSIIAIGAGQFLGRGIGYGSQGQMRLLPASRTDFIFAAICEELGFLGGFFIVLIFLLIFVQLIKMARIIYDDFGFLLILGLAFNLFLQVIFNIGMNLGLLPIIGNPLPLISYGGSSMLMNLIALGLVESVIIYQTFTKREKNVQ